jgi:hypothetical protein
MNLKPSTPVLAFTLCLSLVLGCNFLNFNRNKGGGDGSASPVTNVSPSTVAPQETSRRSLEEMFALCREGRTAEATSYFADRRDVNGECNRIRAMLALSFARGRHSSRGFSL